MSMILHYVKKTLAWDGGVAPSQKRNCLVIHENPASIPSMAERKKELTDWCV
jgi:hypothetical protein